MATRPSSEPDVTDQVLEQLLPLGGQLSFGSMAGYCAGVALKTAGRVAAVAVGSVFITVQGLAYLGM